MRMTKILIGDRCSGKTVALIQESARTGIYIMVANKQRAEMVFDRAKRMGCDIPYPVTVHEYFRRSDKFIGSSIERDGVYIDDIDDIVAELFEPLDIHAVTMCPLNEKLVENPMEWARRAMIREQDLQLMQKRLYREILAALHSPVDSSKSRSRFG